MPPSAAAPTNAWGDAAHDHPAPLLLSPSLPLRRHPDGWGSRGGGAGSLRWGALLLSARSPRSGSGAGQALDADAPDGAPRAPSPSAALPGSGRGAVSVAVPEVDLDPPPPLSSPRETPRGSPRRARPPFSGAESGGGGSARGVSDQWRLVSSSRSPLAGSALAASPSYARRDGGGYTAVSESRTSDGAGTGGGGGSSPGPYLSSPPVHLSSTPGSGGAPQPSTPGSAQSSSLLTSWFSSSGAGAGDERLQHVSKAPVKAELFPSPADAADAAGAGQQPSASGRPVADASPKSPAAAAAAASATLARAPVLSAPPSRRATGGGAFSPPRHAAASNLPTPAFSAGAAPGTGSGSSVDAASALGPIAEVDESVAAALLDASFASTASDLRPVQTVAEQDRLSSPSDVASGRSESAAAGLSVAAAPATLFPVVATGKVKPEAVTSPEPPLTHVPLSRARASAPLYFKGVDSAVTLRPDDAGSYSGGRFRGPSTYGLLESAASAAGIGSSPVGVDTAQLLVATPTQVGSDAPAAEAPLASAGAAAPTPLARSLAPPPVPTPRAAPSPRSRSGSSSSDLDLDAAVAALPEMSISLSLSSHAPPSEQRPLPALPPRARTETASPPPPPPPPPPRRSSTRAIPAPPPRLSAPPTRPSQLLLSPSGDASAAMLSPPAGGAVTPASAALAGSVAVSSMSLGRVAGRQLLSQVVRDLRRGSGAAPFGAVSPVGSGLGSGSPRDSTPTPTPTPTGSPGAHAGRGWGHSRTVTSDAGLATSLRGGAFFTDGTGRSVSGPIDPLPGHPSSSGSVGDLVGLLGGLGRRGSAASPLSANTLRARSGTSESALGFSMGAAVAADVPMQVSFHRGSLSGHSRVSAAASAAAAERRGSSAAAALAPVPSLQRVPMATLSYRDTILSIVRSSPYGDDVAGFGGGRPGAAGGAGDDD